MGKTVLVFGANGNVGSHFINLALEAGYTIKAFVRNPKTYKLAGHQDVEVVKGDATNSQDIESAMQGVDIVVSCLGNAMKKKIYIMDTAYDLILSIAAKQAKPPRCLMISTIGANGSSGFVRFLLRMIAGKERFTDYEKADQRALDEKQVPVVLIRPAGLTDKPGTGAYQVIDKSSIFFPKFITRSDVAKFFVDCLKDTSFDGRAVMIQGR